MFLEKINGPSDLRSLKINQLKTLATETREYIIEIISQNGGHLASSLGAVEITIALHYVFNTPIDKIIWDVGHQTYAHKILTGRRESFPTIRKIDGLSGFPKRKESNFDPYNVGHSSTSLSLALGEAMGRDLNKKNYKVVAVIGDGSLTGGMAFEALNNMGHLNNDLIIILNDNEHSISKNTGGLAKYLTKIITTPTYNKFRHRSRELIKNLPKVGNYIYNALNKYTHSFKGLFVPGQFFEDLGVRYFGPVDGHNLEDLINILNKIKTINHGPKIIHTITKKGKGYKPAENRPAFFHGLGPFNKETGQLLKDSKNLTSFSEIAGQTILGIAQKDEKILAITAAMKEGTGLAPFAQKFPDRFFDVGIAEEHAITFSGALASNGFKPFVILYSTFMQRGIDQLIHDIGIMNLPIKLLIDRAGVVGADGETHHGLFDLALLKNIPNFILLAPSDQRELQSMINFAANYDKNPIAIRYPKGQFKKNSNDSRSNQNDFFALEELKIISEGEDLLIITIGDMFKTALELNDLLETKNIKSTIINLLTLKPLPLKKLENLISQNKSFITIENGVVSGGIGEGLLAKIDKNLKNKCLFQAGFPDDFIPHGENQQLFEKYGLDPDSLAKRVAQVKKN